MQAMDIKDKKALRDNLLQWLYTYLFTKKYSFPVDLRNPETFFPGGKGQEAALEGALSLLEGHLDEIALFIGETFDGPFEELHLVEQALVSLCIYEYRVLKTDKKLVISEGLRLSDKYASQNFDKKLHAYLDSLK
jgi:transcription termination factor NusB